MRYQKIDRSERGFTLIELMATLLISSVLLFAMYQNYVVSQRSYSLLAGYSTLQENARFSEDAMARTIRMAGYRANPGQVFGVAFPADPYAAAPTANTFASAGQVISGGNNDAAVAAIVDGTDSISIRFDGGGTMTDCFGRDVIDTYSAVNSFYVQDNAPDSDSLNCSSIITRSDGTTSSSNQPLVEGAEDLQIIYGVDSDGDTVADTYLNAGAIAAAQWPNVVSVRIAALYTTVNRVPDTSTQSFTMLDNGTVTFTDGLRRQLFIATINLRNKSL